MFQREILRYSKITFVTAIVVLLIQALFIRLNDVNWLDRLGPLLENLETGFTNPLNVLVWSMPYLLIRFLQLLTSSFRNKDRKGAARTFGLYLLVPSLLLTLLVANVGSHRNLNQFGYYGIHQNENTTNTTLKNVDKDRKHRGVNYFSRRSIEEENLTSLIDNNIEWITLVPYGWQQDYQADQLRGYSDGYGEWSRRDSSFIKRAEFFKQNGFKVMIKPHIWMRGNGDKWRSDIYPQGEAWARWSKSYTHFILHYATLSQKVNVDLFCIGTELRLVAKNYPEYWYQLIRKVRQIYQGPLTYAANWYQEAEEVIFWEKLDFVGVQAYYPLSNKENPSVQELVKGWTSHTQEIESLVHRTGKPILFTEIGYKSTTDAAIEPWEWVRRNDPDNKPVSFETQANAYEAFFRVFWHKKWFQGVHFWQWHGGMSELSSWQQINFTPQLKPAEEVMARWFGK